MLKDEIVCYVKAEQTYLTKSIGAEGGLMNNIFMQNMNAIMGAQKTVIHTVKPRGGTWIKDTTTKKMLRYLNEHGETSGKVLYKAMGAYPTSILRKQINNGQVLVRMVHKSLHYYRLADNHGLKLDV